MSRRIPLLVIVLLASGWVAGCTAPASPTDAPSAAPVSLSLATDDGPGDLVTSQQIQHFADRVAVLSGDQLLIEPDWSANGNLEHNWDQAAAQLVIDGTDELGVIPSRAWDVLGVTSLQAISTPMLITDQALDAAVITSDIAEDLMSGLPDAGVTGLVLFPEALRHPFGLNGHVVAPADFAGGQVRVPTSDASTLLYSTLGATAVDSEPDPATMVALESDFGRDPEGVATANLTWYPKVNVLVGNTSALDGLTDEQRGWLDAAAADTQQWAIDNLPSDADAAAAWCTAGGSMVAASPEQLAAFAAAVEPVRESLAADPLTAEAIAQIEMLKAASTPADAVVAC